MRGQKDLGIDGLSLRIGGVTPLVPLDRSRAKSWAVDLREAAEAEGLDRLAALMSAPGGSSRADGAPPDTSVSDAGRIAAVLDLSPFLNGQMLQHPEWLDQLFDADARTIIRQRIERLADLPSEGQSEAALMTALRLVKREVSLLVALRDLFGAAPVAETTADLSALAEAAVGAAVRFCLREADRTGRITLADKASPEAGSGLIVLAMGKLGGRELNYSSDIDLIIFFDPEAGICTEPVEAVDVFSKLAKRLVRIVGERTADGYVFRTDLRLRPDPGATPLAISIDTAMNYYESSGRNWERAAMIKARPIAGDLAAGDAFLKELSPFVWRRYLDFAAIADIQTMKGRIDEHRGFGAIAGSQGLGGTNVKLGRGGIREIEFFVQAQQLIAGGRSPKLRPRRTDEALIALAQTGWISNNATEQLTADYWFLRRVEHAIQMVADEQTHTLPDDVDGLERIARLAGFAGCSDFGERLAETLQRVDGRFDELFSEGRRRGEPTHNRAEGVGQTGERTLFARLLSSEDDPDALAVLERLGYARPADIARIVRSWGFGRYRATRNEGARKRLETLLPMLLSTFAKSRDPDGAIAAFDAFLQGLPAGIQFFALVASNPRILDLLALVITSAPALRETIAARPHVFDALLDPAFFDEVPDKALMAERLAMFLADGDVYEDRLARLRIFAAEQRFLVGARLLSGVVDVAEAGPAFSNIADVVLAATLDTVIKAFAERHGEVAGGRIALLGMGRLGSRELTAGSDVDLILIYDHAKDAEQSDGEKPLSTSLYYARLTQRLIAAMTAPMREGVLYEVDFRLRPSGKAGPLATPIDTFRRYQAKEAWTWEHMALTRSRPVAGDPEFCAELGETIEQILSRPRDADATARDVVAMRRRLERDKPSRGPLDLKQRPGGLIDLEFLAQWALLTGRTDLQRVGCPTAEVLAAAFSGERGGQADVRKDRDDADARCDATGLAGAMDALTGVVQLLRLGPPGVAGLDDLPLGLGERIARELGAEDVTAIPFSLDAMTAAVRAEFDRLLQFSDPNEVDDASEPSNRTL